MGECFCYLRRPFGHLEMYGENLWGLIERGSSPICRNMFQVVAPFAEVSL